MIETRYDIEYVSPNGKPKSGLGRFFAYLLLLITLLIFLTTLILSNLSDSTSQLVIQKIQQLTGINNKTITNTISINDDVASDESNEDIKVEKSTTTNKLADENHKQDQEALALAKDENEKNKKELKRLSQENTKQNKASKKQQFENLKLRKDLERITEQLAEEKKAGEQLAKKIESLNNENGALNKQLADNKKSNAKKNTAVTSTNEPKKAESVTTKKEKMPKAATIGRTDKLKEESVKTEEPAKPKPAVATQEATSTSKDISNKTITSEKTKKPVSQMDAIIEAMEAAKK